MPAFPSSIARAAASLCEEIWNSLSGENRGWTHLERWTLSEPHSQERATFLAAAVYAANSKCRPTNLTESPSRTAADRDRIAFRSGSAADRDPPRNRCGTQNRG